MGTMNKDNYLAVIFDNNRGGLLHIVENICRNLDYHSFVSLKQSCKLVYSYLQHTNLEEEIFREKLQDDWRFGHPQQKDIPFKLNYPQSNQSPAVTNTKIINDGNYILVSIENIIYQFDFKIEIQSIISNQTEVTDITEHPELEQKKPSKTFTNPDQDESHNQITQFDMLGDYLIAGNKNGILSIWDVKSGDLLSSKHLFGNITELHCVEEENIIVTSHIGKDFGFGCISIRRLVTPTELTVLWSDYQDTRTIFNFDINKQFVVTLEWLGTFDTVRVGGASVYNRDEDYQRRDFCPLESINSVEDFRNKFAPKLKMRFTSLAIFKDHYVAVGSDDGLDGHHALLIWDLSTLTIINTFRSHMCAIMQIQYNGDRLVSQDKDGNIMIWDASLAAHKDDLDDAGEDIEDHEVLMRMLNIKEKENVKSIAMNLRSLAVGKIGEVTLFDFWNSRQHIVKI